MTLASMNAGIRLALATTRAHKMRSFLTVLGVIIGTGAVIGVGSIIAGLDGAITNILRSFGPNTIIALKGPVMADWTPEILRRKPLTLENARAIEARCPAVQHVSPYLAAWAMTVFEIHKARYKGNDLYNIDLGGTEEGYAAGGTTMKAGRFFTDQESAHHVPQFAQHGSGIYRFAENALRQTHGLDQVAFPILRVRIEQLAGAGDGFFIHTSAGQKIIDQVRHEQQPVRFFQPRRRIRLRQQLKQGVKKHELNACPLINLLARQAPEGRFLHALRAAVAILKRRAEQFPVGTQQTIIDAPRVHADGHRGIAVFRRREREALFDVGQQPVEIPVPAVGLPDGIVGKAVQLDEFQPGAVIDSGEHAAAARAEVHRQTNRVFAHSRKLVVLSVCEDRGRNQS